MSTLELEHIKHSSASGNNITLAADGSLSKIHVKSAASGATADAGADELVVEGSGNTGITIASGASSSGSIYFADSGSAYDGWVNYSQTDRKLNFATAQTTRMSIDSDGVINMTNQPSALFQGNDGSWATINAGNVMNRAFTTSGNGAHAHSSITYNQSNGRFTMTKAGKYFVSFTFYCDAAANNDMRIILRQNGGGIAFNHYDFPSTQSTIGNSSSACLNIAANDYIDFYTPYQVSNYGGPQHTFVNIFKVS